MTTQYSAKELKILKTFARKYCKNPKKPPENVNPLFGDCEIKQFVISYLEARGLDWLGMEYSGICSWGNLSMHVDSLYGEKFQTLIFPIKGNGILSHYVTSKSGKEFISDEYFYPVNDKDSSVLAPIRLNDSKPHSFSTKGTCFGILADLPNTVLDKLFLK